MARDLPPPTKPNHWLFCVKHVTSWVAGSHATVTQHDVIWWRHGDVTRWLSAQLIRKRCTGVTNIKIHNHNNYECLARSVGLVPIHTRVAQYNTQVNKNTGHPVMPCHGRSLGSRSCKMAWEGDLSHYNPPGAICRIVRCITRGLSTSPTPIMTSTSLSCREDGPVTTFLLPHNVV